MFKESLETAVFTTKFVVEDGSTIVFVTHDEDGSWQFFGKEEVTDSKDYRLVGLKEIVLLDKTILELSKMPVGSEAYRNNINSPWRVLNSN